MEGSSERMVASLARTLVHAREIKQILKDCMEKLKLMSTLLSQSEPEPKTEEAIAATGVSIAAPQLQEAEVAVKTAEQARIEEKAGTSVVVAMHVPPKTRAQGGEARMDMRDLKRTTTVTGTAKVLMGHATEAQILETAGVDHGNEIEVRSAYEVHQISKRSDNVLLQFWRARNFKFRTMEHAKVLVLDGRSPREPQPQVTSITWKNMFDTPGHADLVVKLSKLLEGSKELF